MICAEDELGLGDDHDGIIVLPEETVVGTPASEVYNLESDIVYEIGLTPNRSDATNHLGVAKDLGAALKINYAHSGEVAMPDVTDFKVEKKDAAVEVEVRNAEACPRYAGVSITNLKIAESPDWLKNRLKAVGVRPINNVVDITNFILHEFGQPLHAFDLSKITNNKIIVETLPEGSIFKSLDEVERKLLATDLMICDGAEKGMCIGGVFGGIDSGVTDGTTAIFLESAHFNPKSIRRSSMHHNLRTDAAKVFEKGSDPNICVYALKRAALMMQELAGGVIASDIVDLYPEEISPVEITTDYQHVNTLIGEDISKEKVHEILDALEMKITAKTDSNFTVKVPTNKADVLRPADVIEEILRIYGLNNVPMSNKISMSLTYGTHPSKQSIRNTISDLLVGNGFIECMNLSLSQSK
ncbi:MAG: phenylalanine--tRNA ligase subunit beta, partial [Bacteroidota bacterium]